MNQAHTAGQPAPKPDLGNTGQYTISVSKPGTGEDPELLPTELLLHVSFLTEGGPEAPTPSKCRVELWSDYSDRCLFSNKFGFLYSLQAPHHCVASAAIKLDEPWQHNWWVDIYLHYETSDEAAYALSAYLSTLFVDNMTVTCTYHSDPQPNRRDG